MKTFNEWLKEKEKWVCGDCGKEGIEPFPQICPRCKSNKIINLKDQRLQKKQKDDNWLNWI